MDAVELERWRGRPVEVWRSEWGVPELRIFRRVGSTNDVARGMADAGAGEGSVVLADEQTAGRGRRGRGWSSPAGCSLSLSMLIGPADPPTHTTPLLTVRLGLAAARAIESLYPVEIGLKWPNDLLLDAKKVGGILCEAEFRGSRAGPVVAGLGLNLQTPEDWPPKLAALATSLADAGVDPDPPILVERLVEEWLRAGRTAAGELSDGERAVLRERDALLGRSILIDDEPAGTAVGISPAGKLRVDTEEGRREFATGTIRVHQPQGEPA